MQTTSAPMWSYSVAVTLADTGSNIDKGCVGLHNAGDSGLVKITFGNGKIDSIWMVQGAFLGIRDLGSAVGLVWSTGTTSTDISALMG